MIDAEGVPSDVSDANPEILRLPARALAVDGVRGVIWRYGAELADLRRRVAALYSNPALRDRTLDKFDAARAESKERSDSYWRLWNNYVDTQAAFLAFLSEERGGWRPEGKTFLFLRPDLPGIYYRYTGALDGLRSQISATTSRARSGE